MGISQVLTRRERRAMRRSLRVRFLADADAAVDEAAAQAAEDRRCWRDRLDAHADRDVAVSVG